MEWSLNERSPLDSMDEYFSKTKNLNDQEGDINNEKLSNSEWYDKIHESLKNNWYYGRLNNNLRKPILEFDKKVDDFEEENWNETFDWDKQMNEEDRIFNEFIWDNTKKVHQKKETNNFTNKKNNMNKNYDNNKEWFAFKIIEKVDNFIYNVKILLTNIFILFVIWFVITMIVVGWYKYYKYQEYITSDYYKLKVLDEEIKWLNNQKTHLKDIVIPKEKKDFEDALNEDAKLTIEIKSKIDSKTKLLNNSMWWNIIIDDVAKEIMGWTWSKK